MRIITLNVYGIRSAASKGFSAWMRRQTADVVCLQEIKAQEAFGIERRERRLAHRLPDRDAGNRPRARATAIYVRKRFSDHAPLTIDYAYEL